MLSNIYWNVLGLHLFVAILEIQPEALSWGLSACSSCSLQGISLADRYYGQDIE